MAHPNYDEFWQKLAFAPYFKDLTLTVPNLNVAGWWDQEDFFGPMKVYELLEKNDTKHNNYLAVGPWNHGGWARSDGTKLGNIDFGSNTSAYFRKNIQAPWFAYWLKDKGTQPVKEAMTFETGTNEWKTWEAWPPREGVTPRKLYFRDDAKLSFEAPEDKREAFDTYLSDPANPVPYRHASCGGNVFGGEPVVHVAARGPAIRPAAAGHAFVGDGTAHGKRDGGGGYRGASIRVDDWNGQRLDCEID